MFHKAVNNAKTRVAAPYTPTSGQLVVTDASVFGNSFPVYVTAKNGATERYNVFEVTSVSGSTLMVTGGLDGTTDIPLNVNDVVQMSVVAAHLNEIHDSINALISNKLSTLTKTSNYTMAASDFVVFADSTNGNVTITLPDASSALNRYYIVKQISSANSVTVGAQSSQTIDGNSSLLLSPNSSISIASNGSNWFII